MMELIIKHLRTKGLQNRWKHIYYPFLKWLVKYLWAFWRNESKYQTFYANNETVIDEVEPAKTRVQAPLTHNSLVVPDYEDIADELNKYSITSFEQGQTGQCTAFTFANSYTQAIKTASGFVQKFSAYDVYKDRKLKDFAGDDRGMYPSEVTKRVAKNGIALYGALPEVRNRQQLIEADNLSLDDFVKDLRIKGIITGETVLLVDYHGIDFVLRKIAEIPKGLPFQISVDLSSKYFGYDIPIPNSDKFGRHSIMGIGGFVFNHKGQRTIRVIDSAHQKRATIFKHPSHRHLQEAYLKGENVIVRIFTFSQAVLDAVGYSNPIDIKEKVTPVMRGNNNKAVKILQRKLISLGYVIPAGATGYYGSQTARAVKKFKEDRYRVYINSTQANNFYQYDCDVINSL